MRRIALLSLLACGHGGSASADRTREREPACPVPSFDELTASNDVVFSRRGYFFTAREYTYVLRDGRLLHRAARTTGEGACGALQLTVDEMARLRAAAAGLCTWSVLPEEPLMDQGRLEYVDALGPAPCTRNEATTSIIPISPADVSTGAPLPALPTWSRLNDLLDAWIEQAKRPPR